MMMFRSEMCSLLNCLVVNGPCFLILCQTRTLRMHKNKKDPKAGGKENRAVKVSILAPCL